MADIKDNVLYSKETWEVEFGGKMNWTSRFITRVLDLVKEELMESGDRDWMVDAVEESSVRISHMEGVSRRVASGLHKLGLRPGHVLHAAYNTRLDFYWPVFGAWLCGAAVSVSDPDLSTEVIRTQLVDTGASIVVIAHSALKTFQDAASLLKDQVKHILLIDVEPWQELPPGCSSFKSLYNDDGLSCPKLSSLPDYDPEEVAIIHWTSGTTGVPKGVQHTQKYLHLALRKSKIPPRSGSLQSNTMFHVGAFLLPLDGGIRNRFACYIVQEKHFSPERMIQVIAKYKPLFYMANPYHVQSLSTLVSVEEDVSSLMCIMPSGGQCTHGSVQKLHSLFPGLKMVFHFYGSTEVGPITWTFDVSSSCLGVMMPGCSAYIRDPDTGAKLGQGETGEIMVRSLAMTKGYLNRDQANREFFAGDGYCHMGDLGYYDHQGKLYFKDRAKELIKVTSRWVGPGELEDLIEQVGGVMEACVWSTYSQHTADDIIHAAVVTRPGSRVSKEELVDYVSNNTEPHKHLTGDVFFMDEIPHNPQGKKLRRVLKNQYLEQKLIASDKLDL